MKCQNCHYGKLEPCVLPVIERCSIVGANLPLPEMVDIKTYNAMACPACRHVTIPLENSKVLTIEASLLSGRIHEIHQH